MNEQIKKIAKELCEESTCHHKCPTTDDCIVEDDAKLLINKGKEGYYCYGKKDFCHKGNDNTVKCGDCEFFNDEGGEILLINQNKSNNFDVKSNEELFKQALVEGLSNKFDKILEEAKQIEQIDEMARDICHLNVSCEECTMLAKQMGQSKDRYCKAMQYAKRAYEKGWRKQYCNLCTFHI